MHLNLLFIITSQSHIKKVLFLPKILESSADVGLKVVPAETELLSGGHGECGKTEEFLGIDPHHLVINIIKGAKLLWLLCLGFLI